MTRQRRYSQEVREWAMRLVEEHLDEYSSEWAAMVSVSSKLGMTPETLRHWVRRAQIDGGLRPGLTTDERQQLKQLQKENRELRRANEILKDASISRDRARRSNQEVVRYIESRKDRWGVEPICKVLQFAPATYYASIHRPASQRAIRDEELVDEVHRVHDESRRRYGADKVWRQMHLDGVAVARCTVERLIKRDDLVGVRRDRHWKTTISDETMERPADLVERNFTEAGIYRRLMSTIRISGGP